MDNIPSLQKKEAKFRNVTSSKDYNEAQDETLYDILNLFNKANKLRQDIELTKDIIHTENKYMQMKVSALEDKLKDLSQVIDDTARNDGYKTLNVHISDMYMSDKEVDSAHIDYLNNSATLPSASMTSKVNIYDETEEIVFIPPSLQLELTPNADHINIIDNNITNAFNGDNSSYWRRKIITDNSISAVTTSLIIGLPDDIISNREINSLILTPYPYGSLDIISIEYKLFGDWKMVPSFDQHNSSILESYSDAYGNKKFRPVINNAANIKLSFKEITANEIRITFRQRNYIQEGDKRVFYIGAREIQILSCKYNKDTAALYAKVEFKGNQSRLISDIKSILNNQAEVGDNVIQYEFYYLDEYDIPSKIPYGFPFEITNNKMLIKAVLHKNNTTPDLYKMQLIYKNK